MLRSVIRKSGKTCFIIVITALALLYFGFKSDMTDQEMLAWSNKCLAEVYDPSGETKLKKWDLTLTDDEFLRLRKVFINGRQEYYSFKIHSLNSMNYLGTATGGTLQFKTNADDVIVQTYNDPKGDIDSMGTELDIPVKNLEPDRLDSLQMTIDHFKKKDL
jgi:hypothetical protein